MFTGIIENTGIVKKIICNDTNKTFWIASKMSNELKIDQSLSHSGVCLTVEEINEGMHRVTAIEETLNITTLNNWQIDTIVNLERCLLLNGRLDGHIVQGHIDTIAQCTNVLAKGGSWEFSFTFSGKYSPLIIEKGSITINGISLTLFNVGKNNFSVAIIPYTFNNTNISTINIGDFVNIEFDILGKYINRQREL